MTRIGEVDTMSRYAAEFRMPLCRSKGRCTRAAGHDAGYLQKEKKASTHVAVDGEYRIAEVWPA